MREMYLPMAAYVLATTALARFDVLFVRHYLLDESAGYGAVVTLGQIPLWMVSPVIFVIFPLASAEHAAGRAVLRSYRQALLLGSAVGLLCTAGLALVAEPLFHYWNEAAFAGYGHYVWVYAVMMLLHCLIQIVASVEMARHRYRFLFILVPCALLMFRILYPRGSSATLSEVLGVMIGVRVLALLGMLALSFRGFREVDNAAPQTAQP